MFNKRFAILILVSLIPLVLFGWLVWVIANLMGFGFVSILYWIVLMVLMLASVRIVDRQ
jgi:hypothetical protein